jgi:hypothetical protein
MVADTTVRSKNALKCNCKVTSIIVKENKTGTQTQVLTPGENSLICSFVGKPLFTVEDMNFDGYRDIRMFLPGAHTIMSYYTCWLYDPATKLFVKEDKLEELPNLSFDAGTKEIVSMWMAGCCDNGINTFKYIDGKLVLVNEWKGTTNN